MTEDLEVIDLSIASDLFRTMRIMVHDGHTFRLERLIWHMG